MNEFGPLYHPHQERDACGVGFVANVSGAAEHRILAMALECVTNLTHRGALDADAKTGDGAGVLFQIPKAFFAAEAERLGARVERPQDLAVGMVFLPGNGDHAAAACRDALERAARDEGLDVLAWREVPVDPSVLGDAAARSQPRIEQVLLARRGDLSDADFERVLLLVRKAAERWAVEQGIEGFYVPSLSCRTVVYKGLLVAHQLNTFYRDLADPAFETSFAMFHQRYSTNTFPNWVLAQPFRMLAHNGEINTLQGNRNWQRAREPELHSSVWGERIERLKPVIQEGGSDSASLDNVLEAVVLSGRDPLHAMMMLIPEAWENMPNMEASRRDFYEYHASITEPWDGPASVAFTDGVFIGAVLDRNGLRPARYQVTADGLIVMGSEAGMIELPEESVVEKGRLGPGHMIVVDTERGVLLRNDDIKDAIASRQPYGEWVQRNLVHLDDYVREAGVEADHPELDLQQQQIAFGYTREELQYVIKPMAGEGKEPVGSMGDDTPLAVFEQRRRLLPYYFKQKFAQVSNPPIDPIREELVMSLDCYLGQRRSLFEETPEHARLLHLNSPLIMNEEMAAIGALDNGAFACERLPCLFPVAEGPDALRPALERLCEAASAAIDAGRNVLVLSDRAVDAAHAPVPMLLAVGAVHHHLIRAGKRMRASIVAETAEARDVHQIALLLGYGASAVNPYLAFETIANMYHSGVFKDAINDLDQAITKYEGAVEAGVLKIMSKMGISCVSSYTGGQIFEAVGLGPEVIDTCFAGTPSRVGGIGFREVAEDALERHRAAFQPANGHQLEPGGFYKFRKDAEYHGFNPDMVRALHRAMESGAEEDFEQYVHLSEERGRPAQLRDLLRIRKGTPVPLDEVEPIGDIMRRFATGAMSLGALSPEAHLTVAIGMNRIGGKSDTGEGGEEAWRYYEQRDGDGNSRIKQVASGRFGVTPEYLINATELEIKMAQGSKPGEGGQLPGHKVSDYIAAIRHTLPGTPLISPPPHHDIYSIEDLAQLIHDLKTVNPRARVCVKLVAEEGVGTIAAGVAKGYADTIQVSGCEGGTGASPLSSIKNAGLPWELGVAETQQVLVQNDLRSRVVLRTDGGFRTGRDVIVAALLGAEEYGFGTAALVAIGCQMARQCHLNTCPVGVATQREDLRKKFTGTPEDIVRFFGHVAEEVREILAAMGFRSLDDVIGRMDLLEPAVDVSDPRAAMLDLRPLLWVPEDQRPLRCMQRRNDRAEPIFDDRVIEDVRDALDGKGPVKRDYKVRNIHRTIGARLGGEIARRYRREGLPEGTIELHLRGSAGQSFGAFCHTGLRLILTGEANDYVGKGMGGGEIAVRPPEGARFTPCENVIVGNTVLYGATGGSLFAAGRAGERFAVRNSGAKAVVEGVGDHGCEYMTEGIVVILGETGRNFGAGMSNGIAYVLDEHGTFQSNLNPELVKMSRISDADDIEMLQGLIQRHVQLTDSARGRDVLDRWDRYLPLFWKVAPESTTEEGPQRIIHRHLQSLRQALAVG